MRKFALAAALLAVFAPAALAEPVRSAFAGADPDILAAEERYWIYPTGGEGLFAWSSADLKRWRKERALLRQRDIGWIEDDRASVHYLWAPDMVSANGRYYLYYSVGPQNPTPSRIGVAACVTPAGPCKDSGKPLVTGGDGFEAIDPAVFVDPASETRYLYAGGSAGAKLRLWVLKPDMVTIEREIAVDTPTGFTEGAFMHLRGGVYYLSYSSGRWNRGDYQVHYATAPSPTGPWRYRGPILVSEGNMKGPGHHSFIEGRDGRWYIAYHRWEGRGGDGPYRGNRRIAIQPIAYLADGTIAPVRMNRAPPGRGSCSRNRR